MYPSIDIENNIASNTQIGKIIIEEKVFDQENRFCDDKYTRGGEFIENIVCDNIIEFSNRWLHLGTFSDLLNDIKEYYVIAFDTTYGYKYLFNDYIYENGAYITSPIKMIGKSKAINPIVYTNNHAFNPIKSFNPRPTL